MRPFALALLALICLATPTTPAPAQDPPLVEARVLHSQAAYAQGESYPLAIALTIRPGWSIISDQPKAKGAYPTTMLLQCSADCSFSPAVFPKTTARKPGPDQTPLEVFGGTVVVRTTLTVAKTAQLGPQLLGARLSYQGCDDNTCALPDDLEIPIQIKVIAAGQTAAPLNQEVFRKR